ncbi:MBL fold metallo-hydrolase [Lichenibacterium minor]|uniref:MBL fold metallo-hydrolase n=1 Tax=Lichenibacterium minor TaxID=2316528 RepID=A0A4Q2UBA3_9HYPH|nr:MBL fold metallo-hydrolase [Lichenibacterium minor]RYC34063.1 MBL fold metallo-hydrolase [Lichenibacterium minor]
MALTHPESDEIEVTVIGPGFGESVLIHLGDRKWITIDCCVDRNTKQNVPLAYLAEIGADVASDIKLVIASHWHDDHIKGLFDLLTAAKSARFCCSEALTSVEFCAYAVRHAKNITRRFSGGASEFLQVLRLLAERKNCPEFAGKDRRLWLLPKDTISHGVDCEVYTLAPSNGQFALFLTEISKILADPSHDRFRAQADNQNNLSVVCQILFGEESILLGADLENQRDVTLGWESILSSFGRPRQTSSFFKIPHHGSANAHNDRVWTDMLVSDVFSVVTPYDRLVHPLPTQTDRARINAFTPHAYITSDEANKNFRHDDKSVNAKLKDIGAVVQVSQIAPGRVTRRWKLGGRPSLSMSQMARPLNPPISV